MKTATSYSTMRDLRSLQEKISYSFKDISSLLQALTHTSWANENGQDDFHNERLEFLGDAVLELCITEELCRRFPEAREGVLTSMRSRLVNESELAFLAGQIGIGKCLRLGKGEESQGGRDRPAILADAFEAVLAAIYEDGGIDAAKKTIAAIYGNIWPEKPEESPGKDPKTLILEYCQAEFHEPPIYSILSASGPSHDRTFKIELQMPDKSRFSAIASSTKKAEQAAALAALKAIEKNTGSRLKNGS